MARHNFFLIFILLLVINTVDCGSQSSSSFLYHDGAVGEPPKFARLTHDENLALQLLCGIETRAGPRLTLANAPYAAPGDFPWAAALVTARQDRNGFNNNCGATIISPRHLLSAAHCFFDYKRLNLPCYDPVPRVCGIRQLVYGGVCLAPIDECRDRDVRIAQMRRVAALNAFNDNNCTQGNDLALIELTKDLEFDTLTQPVCLMGNTKHALNRSSILSERVTNIESFGWGRDENHQLSYHLRHTRANFYDTRQHAPVDIATLMGQRNQQSSTNSLIDSGDSGAGAIGFDTRTGRRVLLGVHSYAALCDYNCNIAPSYYAITLAHEHVYAICKLIGVCPPGVLAK